MKNQLITSFFTKVNTKQPQNLNKIEWKCGFKFILLKDDLTIQNTMVIVNAANNELWLGGGVAGAIRKKGGEQIQKECKMIIMKNNNNSLSNGQVVETGIGNFKNENLKYIFHAIGPVYYNGKRREREDLSNAFMNCFLLSEKLNCESISLPPISSGIFGYPKYECAEVFYECLRNFILEKLNKNESFILKEVRLTIIDQETFSVFESVHLKMREEFKKIFGSEIIDNYKSDSNTKTNDYNNDDLKINSENLSPSLDDLEIKNIEIKLNLKDEKI